MSKVKFLKAAFFANRSHAVGEVAEFSDADIKTLVARGLAVPYVAPVVADTAAQKLPGPVVEKAVVSNPAAVQATTTPKA